MSVSVRICLCASVALGVVVAAFPVIVDFCRPRCRYCRCVGIVSLAVVIANAIVYSLLEMLLSLLSPATPAVVCCGSLSLLLSSVCCICGVGVGRCVLNLVGHAG